MIRLTCGHTVDYLDSSVRECAVKSYTREGLRAVDYLTVCQMCYDDYENAELIVETLEEQGEWLDNGEND